jgi:hypothetical protein
MSGLSNTVSFLGIPLTFVTTRTLETGQEVSIWKLADRTESYSFWRYFGVIPAPATYLGYRIVCQLTSVNSAPDDQVIEELIERVKEKL